jgi:formate dehydrogenase subunit delta
MDSGKLAKMANQIAVNLDYGSNRERVAQAVADHIVRFWSSSMRTAVITAHENNALDLSPVAVRAVEVLRTREA